MNPYRRGTASDKSREIDSNTEGWIYTSNNTFLKCRIQIEEHHLSSDDAVACHLLALYEPANLRASQVTVSTEPIAPAPVLGVVSIKVYDCIYINRYSVHLCQVGQAVTDIYIIVLHFASYHKLVCTYNYYDAAESLFFDQKITFCFSYVSIA